MPARSSNCNQALLLPSLLAFTLCLLLCTNELRAQIVNPNAPVTLSTAPQRDTASNANTSDWVNESARVFYRQQHSLKKYVPDSTLHTFHRRPFSQPWYRDLGNPGSPTQNLLFTPDNVPGPRLGYHVYDVYRYNADSVYYYNTNRPYSVFSYQLGSKLEQVASLLHTQNIRPNWNVAVQYRKINAPGFYKVQRNNHDNAYLSTHYQSPLQHYELFGALVYNKQQHDENGGITNESLLADPAFNDRKTLTTTFQNDAYSTTRSSVVNNLREFTLLLNHSYTLGRGDTLYNEDSTQFSYRLTPRFRIGHRLQLTTEKHLYEDMRPDSVRYLPLFTRGFLSTDSVYSEQRWTRLDNGFTLSGILGQREKPLLFSAGVGNRIDKFQTRYDVGSTANDIVSNYVTGELKKESLDTGQWAYQASAQLFVTGQAAGNFILQASVGKDLNRLGSITAGFQQQLSDAPYNFQVYQNQFFAINNSFSPTSITMLYGTVESPLLKLSGGVRNYTIANYIYIDAAQTMQQQAAAFNLTQAWIRKVFTWRAVVLDNELAYQQPAGTAPINVPTLMGRHQLSVETFAFKRALRVATGAEVRYHTPYQSAGYSPYFNRFSYQDTYTLTNNPELAVFFNFRIKKFRAFLMADQLQQLFGPNLVTAQGYPMQNMMIRFGFSWVLVN